MREKSSYGCIYVSHNNVFWITRRLVLKFLVKF